MNYIKRKSYIKDFSFLKKKAPVTLFLSSFFLILYPTFVFASLSPSRYWTSFNTMFKKKTQKETRKVPCFPDNHNLLQLVHWGVNQQAFKVTVIWSGEFLDLELKRKKLVKINVENKGSIDLSACLNCEAAENSSGTDRLRTSEMTTKKQQRLRNKWVPN